MKRRKAQKEIEQLKEEQKQLYYDEMNREEQNAVDKIKSNSRYFFLNMLKNSEVINLRHRKFW